MVYVGYQQPKIEPHMLDRAQRIAFCIPGTSSMHAMMSLNSNNDDFSSIVADLDAKCGNQDGYQIFTNQKPHFNYWLSKNATNMFRLFSQKLNPKDNKIPIKQTQKISPNNLLFRSVSNQKNP